MKLHNVLLNRAMPEDDPNRARARHLLAAGLLVMAVVQEAAAAPAAGRYEGRLCVATAATPDCGPAQVEFRRAGRQATVRVSDLSYALTLHGNQVDVVLKHGAMQIDGFSAAYEWKGSALHFVDAEKGVRYEVQVGERRP
jgi:hypothetical protein